MLDKYVTSYYQPHNAPPSPFEGKIVDEIGAYWLLETKLGTTVRALKAACSTKPRLESEK